MIKHTTFAAMVATVALAAGAGVGLSGCGPAVPAKPTWEADVYPLLVARCIRCHDSPSRSDPGGLMGAVDFNFPTRAAAGPAVGILQAMALNAIKGILTPMGLFKTRMPPPPAEALADWEIQIIDNWSKEPTPL